MMSSGTKVKLRYVFFVILPTFITIMAWGKLFLLITPIAIIFGVAFIPKRFRSPLAELIIGTTTAVALYMALVPVLTAVSLGVLLNWGLPWLYWVICYLLT